MNKRNDKDISYRPARELALRVLVEVERRKAYVNLILTDYISRVGFTPRERGLSRELAYGVIQRLNTLDWALGLFLSRPLASLTPWIRNILRMGAYQLFFLERIPPYAAINEAVKLARLYGHRGVAGLVNAVLRQLEKNKRGLPWPDLGQDPVAFISLKYSHPAWLVERWVERYGIEETIELCRANNEIPPLTIRVNTLFVSREELSRRLVCEGVEEVKNGIVPESLVVRTPVPLTSLPAFKDGLFYIQGESSMMASRVLDPQPGEKVIDVCGAPGGKATHIAQLMNNCGQVLSGDFYPARVRLIDDTARRLGTHIVKTIEWDGRSLPEKTEFADRVIVDAPCSGLGVIRHKPDIKWYKHPGSFTELKQLQQALLKEGARVLRRGGTLLYCTCTNEPEETLEVVRELSKSTEVVPSPVTPKLPERIRNSLGDDEAAVNLLPHIHSTDGFFMARFVKKGS